MGKRKAYFLDLLPDLLFDLFRGFPRNLLLSYFWAALISGVHERVVSKRVVLADVPGTQKRGCKNRFSWTPKNQNEGTRNGTTVKKRERGHICQNRPFTNRFLGRCPSTVRPVFPVLVFQLSKQQKQQNRTWTASSVAS